MGDFKITVENKTGDDGTTGRDVEVMLFQTLPDPLTTNSYSNAWKVQDIQSSGSLGPVVLPEKTEFYVIDHPVGVPRESGPFKVKFGDVVDVIQTTASSVPSVEVVGSDQPGAELKVNNKSGNVQPLEMALYKNGKKMVSIKDVKPGDSAYLAIRPVICLGVIEGIIEGEDFEATTQTAGTKRFALFSGKPDVKIEIRQLPRGQLEFIKV